MPTITRVYKSTDGGAPVLTGQNAKFIDLLTAVLVNGYNSKTITIARTGDTATASCVAHGFVVGQSVLISGATPTAYNGEWRVLTVAADSFTFTITGTPATPATGTITCLVAPAGWTKPFTGTNKAAFRNKVASGGSGMYLRVLDAGSHTGGARDASGKVYSVMTTVDAGSDVCPSAAQMTNGVYLRKSATADATARPWQIWADEKTCYVWVEHYSFAESISWNNMGSSLYAFGDFDSHIGGDGYNYFIAGNTESTVGTNATGGGFTSRYSMVNNVMSSVLAPSGYYMPRNYLQVTGPVVAQTFSAGQDGPYVQNGIGSALNATFAWPEVGSRLKLITPAYIIENGCFRGRLRGVWAPMGNIQNQEPELVSRETFIDGKVIDFARNDYYTGSSYIGFLGIEASAAW